MRRISYSAREATVTTEDGKVYKADYVMVSVSIGVLQTNLIKFTPPLPVSSLNSRFIIFLKKYLYNNNDSNNNDDDVIVS